VVLPAARQGSHDYKANWRAVLALGQIELLPSDSHPLKTPRARRWKSHAAFFPN
jgi:hypothetical protein